MSSTAISETLINNRSLRPVDRRALQTLNRTRNLRRRRDFNRVTRLRQVCVNSFVSQYCPRRGKYLSFQNTRQRNLNFIPFI
jgi:hypothetical protein